MPQPTTIVTLIDGDGDEFPIRLPGIFYTNYAADYAAALQILAETPDLHPTEPVTLGRVEYLDGSEVAPRL